MDQCIGLDHKLNGYGTWARVSVNPNQVLERQFVHTKW